MNGTGGGPGSNQYGPRGVGKRSTRKRPESNIDLGAEERLSSDREWDAHSAQYGETPLEEGDREFLTAKYQHIVTLDDVNLAESENIAMALDWLIDNPFGAPDTLLNQGALLGIHRRMFGNVWTWAGRLRTRETNMGVDPGTISEQWEVLLRNTLAQIKLGSFPIDEVVVRLHRGMLSIHCFTNGNGRHARVVANELARSLGLGFGRYTWGRRSGGDREEIRREYLDALRLADVTGEYGPLVKIALS
ncbi:MAG: mobile mystery protein B [Actinobacteria bacterium]|nr:mobile mystery protein B [Actinomycetota bacterium]MCL5444900.1 mobile mystery protein B [Actinomycetota bacterium]